PGGSHSKYVLVKSYNKISYPAWNKSCHRSVRKLNRPCLCASSLSKHRYKDCSSIASPVRPSRSPMALRPLCMENGHNAQQYHNVTRSEKAHSYLALIIG